MKMVVTPTFGRVVVKVSGESLGASDPGAIWEASKALVDAYSMGIDLGLVVGGGNYVRGDLAPAWGIDRSSLDIAGMIATGLNAYALSAVLRASGVPTQVFGRGPCAAIESAYTQTAVQSAIERKVIAIIAGGMGRPGISTDVAAVHLAGDIHADSVIMSKFGIDGVYDADPRQVPSAQRLSSLDATYALKHGLQVMDQEALTLAIEKRIPIRVIPADRKEGLQEVLAGYPIGSIIHPR